MNTPRSQTHFGSTMPFGLMKHQTFSTSEQRFVGLNQGTIRLARWSLPIARRFINPSLCNYPVNQQLLSRLYPYLVGQIPMVVSHMYDYSFYLYAGCIVIIGDIPRIVVATPTKSRHQLTNSCRTSWLMQLFLFKCS